MKGRDLLPLWLRGRSRDLRRDAGEAERAFSDPGSAGYRAAHAIAQCHREAAAVYERALAALPGPEDDQ